MPNVVWSNLRPVDNSRSELHSAFFELTRVHDLFQSVNFPTRRRSARNSVMDLLSMNRNNLMKSVVLTPGISEHDVVAATIEWKKIEMNRPRLRKVFAYGRGRFDAINSELDAYLPSFIRCCQSNDIESLRGLFKEKLLRSVNIYVPSKIVTANRRGDKPWITKDIRASIRRKARVYKDYCRTGSAELFSNVRALGSCLKKQIKLAKRDYLSSLNSKIKTNPKGVWRYIESNKKDICGIPFIRPNDELLKDDMS